MELKDLIRTNRSRRRFDQTHQIDRQTLLDLVDLARLSASGANKQPLKFVLCNDPETNTQVFLFPSFGVEPDGKSPKQQL